MSETRADVFARIRRSLGKEAASDPAGVDERAAARRQALAYIAARRRGPIPAMAPDREGLVKRFIERSIGLASTTDTVSSIDAVPAVASRYLEGLGLPRAASCWPELGALDWAKEGLQVEPRVARGEDKVGITGAFCAIAETGTLAILSTPQTPTVNALLPDTHIAVVRDDRVVPAMEDAFALVRAELGRFPRALNFISGPSRTADIAQTLVLGAHGPYRVHVIVVTGKG